MPYPAIIQREKLIQKRNRVGSEAERKGIFALSIKKVTGVGRENKRAIRETPVKKPMNLFFLLKRAKKAKKRAATPTWAVFST